MLPLSQLAGPPAAAGCGPARAIAPPVQNYMADANAGCAKNSAAVYQPFTPSFMGGGLSESTSAARQGRDEVAQISGTNVAQVGSGMMGMLGMGLPDVKANLTIIQAPTQAGVPGTLLFRVSDALGHPITQYDLDKEAYLHLLSVTMQGAAPLRDFQHLHPEYVGEGVWRLSNFTAPEGGMDHVIAAFATGGRMADAQSDITVAGAGKPLDDASGGYAATLVGKTAGADGAVAQVQLIGPDGAPVTQLGQYLGATAHLSLFEPGSAPAQLTFEHGHAETAIKDGMLQIDVGNLAAGTYQGWVQFQTPGPGGKLYTVPIKVAW